MKILISGGHLTPALGLIDWLQQYQPQVEIVFVGRVYSQEKLKQKAVEEFEVRKRSVKFTPFSSIKLERSPWSFFLNSWRLLRSIKQASHILSQENPSCVVSFGGYLAVPLVISAKLHRMPVLTHEGTRVVGLANKLLFKLADQVAHSSERLDNYDLSRLRKPVVRTGTPLRLAFVDSQPKQPSWFMGDLTTKKLLLVLGGNQGAKALNDFIQKILPRLVKESWILVHQVGRSNLANNYRQELISAAAEHKISQNDYYPLEWIEEDDLAWLYNTAVLALSRAGANTIEELIYHQLPSILVPLPHSIFQEQLKNAQELESLGGAIVIQQDQLEIASFLKVLETVLAGHKQLVDNLKQVRRSLPQEPAGLMFEMIQKMINQS